MTQELRRGVTYWDATGAYSDSETNVLCICLSKYELEELRHALHRIDPTAFLVVEEESTEAIWPVGLSGPKRWSKSKV